MIQPKEIMIQPKLDLGSPMDNIRFSDAMLMATGCTPTDGYEDLNIILNWLTDDVSDIAREYEFDEVVQRLHFRVKHLHETLSEGLSRKAPSCNANQENAK